MSRKREAVVRRRGGTSIMFARHLQCATKVPYSSEQVARNAAQALGWAHPDDEPMSPYECPWCGDWHVGHPPPEDRSGRADRRA